MTTHRKRGFQIGVLSNPPQLIACLTALGYIAYRLYFLPPLQDADLFTAIMSTDTLVAVAVLAAICFIAPVKFMFLAAFPILYTLLPGMLRVFTAWTYWGERHFLLLFMGSILIMVITVVSIGVFGKPVGILFMIMMIAAMVGYLVTVPTMLMLVSVGIIVLAIAYVSDEKGVLFTILLFVFMGHLGLMAYELYERNWTPINLEILGYILLYMSFATAIRAITSGKSSGVPHKAITPTQGHTQEQIEQFSYRDIIPSVETRILSGMAADIKSEYYPNQINYEDVRRGLFVMDSIANKENMILNEGYRLSVLTKWMKNEYNSFMMTNTIYKILSPIIWLVSIALIIFAIMMVPLQMYNAIPFALPFDITEQFFDLFIVAFALGLFLFPPVSTRIYKNFLRKPGNQVEQECINTPDSVLAQFARNGKSYKRLPLNEIKEIDAYLDKICATLGLNAADFKADLGEQSGGGMVFYRVGSGGFRMTGGDIGLTLITQMFAASSNNAVNVRIKALETLAYYNNVVSHFYSKVLTKCDKSMMLSFVPVGQKEYFRPLEGIEPSSTNYSQSHYVQNNYAPTTPLIMESHTLATVGFVLSLIGAVVFIFLGIPAVPGFICSIIALVRGKKFQKPKKGLARAGVIIGINAIIFYGLVAYFMFFL